MTNALPVCAVRRSGSASRSAPVAWIAGALTAGCSLFPPAADETVAPPNAAAAATTTPAITMAQPAAAPPQTAELRSWALELTREHCGACHTGSCPTAKPAALAIYDLDAADWPAALTPPRLRAGYTRRLHPKLDDAGKQRLRDFVETEIASRPK